MPRLRWIALLALVALATAGCKDKDAGKSQPAAAADEQSTKAADDLISRRDALMKSRQKLAEDRKALAEERARVVESGGDTSEIDRKAEELASQEMQISSQETALTDQMQSFLEQVKGIRAGGDAQAQVASRESAMALRERSVASREDRIAQREAELAAREKALAQRERDTCGVAAAPTTIIQTVDPKGAKYSKRDVEPLLRKARDQMSKKGILASDLPGTVAGLEKEATKAMADGDYGPARFAAQQLLANVDAIKIDRAFISGKISRLSAAMKGRKLEDAKQKQVDDLFRDATARYGDGDY
ncbi:MAG: hypothetical protein KC464_29565, partial [Myxococcales bacterium]|nr:hypothetical protein [Myxococcales bacterium]